MKITNALKASLLAAAATALWGLAPGCGPSVGGYCNKVCDCTGCSDTELDECVDSVEDAKKAAEDDGCSSEFDELLSCSSDELTCNDGALDADGCESEAERLGKCSPSGGFPGAASISAYCNKLCDCVGCGDAELEDCVDDIEDTRKLAADQGCSSQFNAVLSCANSGLTCEDGLIDSGDCDVESAALFECTTETGGSGG